MSWQLKTLPALCKAFPGWQPDTKEIERWRKKFGSLNHEWMIEAVDIYANREQSMMPNGAKLNAAFQEVAETKSDKPEKPHKQTLVEQSMIWKANAVSVGDKFPDGFAATVMADVEKKIEAEGPLPIIKSEVDA